MKSDVYCKDCKHLHPTWSNGCCHPNVMYEIDNYTEGRIKINPPSKNDVPARCDFINKNHDCKLFESVVPKVGVIEKLQKFFSGLNFF